MQKRPAVKIGDTFITKEGCTLVVVEYNDQKDVLVEFIDEFRHRFKTSSNSLRKGLIKNPFHPSVCGVGYLGVGDFRCSLDSIVTQEYAKWHHMIHRCYDAKFHEKNPTYKDCMVCDDWHNFQNFAEWYTKQKGYDENYELDKDLLIEGNKIYSPETCVLSPHEINKIMNKKELLPKGCPLGVSFSNSKNKFSASVRVNGNSVHLGYFDNQFEAESVYIRAKKEYLRQKAFEWESRIDRKLFDALLKLAA